MLLSLSIACSTVTVGSEQIVGLVGLGSMGCLTSALSTNYHVNAPSFVRIHCECVLKVGECCRFEAIVQVWSYGRLYHRGDWRAHHCRCRWAALGDLPQGSSGWFHGRSWDQNFRPSRVFPWNRHTAVNKDCHVQVPQQAQQALPPGTILISFAACWWSLLTAVLRFSRPINLIPQSLLETWLIWRCSHLVICSKLFEFCLAPLLAGSPALPDLYTVIRGTVFNGLDHDTVNGLS